MVVELVGQALFVDAVKLGFDLLCRQYLLFRFFCAEVKIIKMVLFFRLLSKDLLEDVERAVYVWIPACHGSHLILLDMEVEVYFLSQSIEFLQPCFRNDFTRHSGIERIFSEFEVLLFVPECAHSAFNCVEKIVSLVSQESKTTANLAVPHVLKD